MNTNNEKTLAERFNELDYMTQRTIINEFPSFFPEYSAPKLNTSNIEHFTSIKIKKSDLMIIAYFILGILFAVKYYI